MRRKIYIDEKNRVEVELIEFWRCLENTRERNGRIENIGI